VRGLRRGQVLLEFVGDGRKEFPLEYLQLDDPEVSDDEAAVPRVSLKQALRRPKLMAARVYRGPCVLTAPEGKEVTTARPDDKQDETCGEPQLEP